MVISGLTKYLGFMLGPEKRLESYTKPLAKYKERASQWGRQGLGLHLSLRAYSVYIASVLGFVTQLEPLPTELFDAAEVFMCRRLFPGPNYWVKPAVLHLLRELGSSIGLQDVRATSVAARSRVFRASAGGGAELRRRERRLRHVVAISGVSHCLWLHTWVGGIFSLTSLRLTARSKLPLRLDALRTLFLFASFATKVPSTGARGNITNGNLWLRLYYNKHRWLLQLPTLEIDFVVSNLIFYLGIE